MELHLVHETGHEVLLDRVRSDTDRDIPLACGGAWLQQDALDAIGHEVS